jgi:hypothetical protein
MSTTSKPCVIVAALAGLLLARSAAGSTIYACANTRTGRVRPKTIGFAVPTCRKKESLTSWVQSGPKIVDGVVNADGSTQALSSGAQVTHLATGKYLIAYPAGTFTTLPAKAITPARAFVAHIRTQLESDGSGTVEVDFESTSGVPVDVFFSFTLTEVL